MGNKISNKVFRKETCPWGKKAIKLLAERGIDFQDNVFESAKDEEDFKTEWSVDTTPQIFLNNERIGGYTELANYFNVNSDN